MGDKAVSRVDVSVGDLNRSQLVVGDHNTIQTPAGTRVTVLQVGDRPVPRLRAMPISRRPPPVEIVGREEELDLIASSAAGGAVQFYAGSGAGKTSLLKAAAERMPTPPEGVVFETTRRRSIDEIQAGLYAAFWECEVPFLPSPAQIGEFLADREALLILDDCGIDRGDLETLLDSVPRCQVVLASEARTLWSRGTARGLGELDRGAAVQLLEREVGHALAPEDQRAAEAVVARLGGNPQALVEAAALIECGQSSLRELANDPAALEQRADPSTLTDSQRRILQVLSAIDGAALGVEHISALADVAGADRELRHLERRGWVKAGSPRYRSLRRLPGGTALHASEAAPRLLRHLSAWSEEAGPRAVAGEAEAIEGALELGVASERWEESLALSLAAERRLFLAGAWDSSQRVLRIGLRAARSVEDESAQGYLLHQLGSQALCLGDRDEAAALLDEALRIRKGRKEREGADLTRHNLRQLKGGGGGPPQWMVVVLVVAALVAAGVLGALALGGGDGGNTAGDDPATITAPPGEGPEIVIDSPGQKEVFDDGDRREADFHCTAVEGTPVDSCDGTVDGTPIEDGASLDLAAGEHTLLVTAVDSEGRESKAEVSYTVSDSSDPAEVDEVAPKISISVPISGQYELRQSVEADYTCLDEDPEVTCDGTARDGDLIDTSTVGREEFVVTSVDSAGNEATPVVVSYEVIEPAPVVGGPEETDSAPIEIQPGPK